MKILDVKSLKENLTKRNLNDIANGTIFCSQIIVNQAGKRVFSEEFGTNGVNGEKLHANATYKIASMTKPITVLALLIEVEKGKVDLQDPVSKYIDGYENLPIGKYVDGKFEIVGQSKTPICIYNLFSHTSGVECGDILNEYSARLQEKDKQTIKEVVEYFADKPLFFETGTAQLYSPHVAFDIGARIVEIVSGLDFATYVKKNITDIIGMKDTTFAPTEEQWSRLVKMHRTGADGKSEDATNDLKHVYGNNPTTYFCGGAGLMSTAEDYSLFAETLLNGGVAPNGKRVIGEETLKKMYTPTCPIEFMDEATQKTGVTWGLGVRVFSNDNGKLPKGTFGWSGAYGTHFYVDPVNKITAIYMKNSESYGGASSLTTENFEDDVMGSLK